MADPTLMQAVGQANNLTDALAHVIDDYEGRIENTDGHSAVLECIKQSAEALSQSLETLQEQAAKIAASSEPG